MEATKPESLSFSTANGNFVEFIISTLFSPAYLEDHAIPKALELSTYPLLPRKLIFVLHKIGEHAVGKEDFDLEEYWRLVRGYFANSSFAPATGKPTVASLVSQALGAVANEENQGHLVKAWPKKRYADYMKEQEGLRDSPVVAAGGQEKPGEAALDETAGMNDTLLNLRTRTVRASKTTETAKSDGGVHTRRRTHDEVSMKESDERQAATKKPRQ